MSDKERVAFVAAGFTLLFAWVWLGDWLTRRKERARIG